MHESTVIQCQVIQKISHNYYIKHKNKEIEQTTHKKYIFQATFFQVSQDYQHFSIIYCSGSLRVVVVCFFVLSILPTSCVSFLFCFFFSLFHHLPTRQPFPPFHPPLSVFFFLPPLQTGSVAFLETGRTGGDMSSMPGEKQFGLQNGHLNIFFCFMSFY